MTSTFSRSAVLRKPTQKALLTLGLVFSALVWGYAVYQDIISNNNPTEYIVPTLDRAELEVERLQALLNNPNYTPAQILAAVQVLAGGNKKGMDLLTEQGAEAIDLESLARILGRQTQTLTDDPESSGRGGEDASLAGLPDVPSVGYTVNDITYAGFEPKSINRHLNDTDPAKAGKDWVYRYLVHNNITPTGNWAEAAAAALNQKHNTDVFRAVNGGDTLVYGDEWVRSTENGYGLRPGQYDANAKGQFFWGYE